MKYNTKSSKEEAIRQVRGTISSPLPKIGSQAPSTTEGVLNARAANMKDRIIAKLETLTLHGQLPRLRDVPTGGLLEDVDATLT